MFYEVNSYPDPITVILSQRRYFGVCLHSSCDSLFFVLILLGHFPIDTALSRSNFEVSKRMEDEEEILTILKILIIGESDVGK